MRIRNFLLNGLIFLVATGASLAAAEVLARRLIPVSSVSMAESQAAPETRDAHGALRAKVSDPRLLFRLAPGARGHDSRGFRNPEALEQADVVVVGDSQTWGVNVPQNRNWPSQLAEAGKVSVYSMALGGWAPPQYAALLDDAIALHPKVFLMAIYFGNDFAESCSYVYQDNSPFAQWRSNSASIVPFLQEMEGRQERYIQTFRDFFARKKFDAVRSDPRRRVWLWLIRHFHLARIAQEYGLIPGYPSTAELDRLSAREWAEQHPDTSAVYDHGGVSTVLTFGYRHTVLDRSVPCIMDGIRITKAIISAMRSTLGAAEVKLGVVLIPTKEMVYATADPPMLAKAPELMRRLAEDEGAIKSDLMKTCAAEGLVCIDALPFLAERARNGEPLYKEDSDGHPIAAGYAAIARAGYAALVELGLIR